MTGTGSFSTAGMLRQDMSLSQMGELLDATPWSSDFAWEEILQLSGFVDCVTVHGGEVVFHEHDEQACMFLVIEGEVVPGMNKDEVFMCWDKPKKIRKDFKRDAYVDVLNYEFERDRKGREFLLRPDSQTSYKNEVFTRFVYMHNGLVFSIVEEGQEENVMDDLPVEDKPEPVEPDRDRVEDVLDDEDLPPED